MERGPWAKGMMIYVPALTEMQLEPMFLLHLRHLDDCGAESCCRTINKNKHPGKWSGDGGDGDDDE